MTITSDKNTSVEQAPSVQCAVQINLSINGDHVVSTVEARTSLVDYLRDSQGLTGSHVGCEHGVCGACTVVVDGRITRGCLMLAVQADGCIVETIEGLADSGALGELQNAFHRHNALQCGFCTAGMLLTANELLQQQADVETRSERVIRELIREAISGNYCRCTGYQSIVDAIHEVLVAPGRERELQSVTVSVEADTVASTVATDVPGEQP